jgi:transposase-like protein
LGSRAESLPPVWWRDPEQLQAQVAEHGSMAAVARHHGLSVSTLKSAWSDLGLPPRPRGRAQLRAVTTAPGDTVSREEMLEQRVKELERSQHAGREEDVLRERMVFALKQAIASKEPTHKPKLTKVGGGKDAHEMALLWSDAHAGEVVSHEETNGLNSYDWQVMMRRHDEITRGVLSYKENRPYPVDRLHIWSLGDMLSGNIHQELAETNEFPIIECAIQFGLDGAEWLEQFVPHFREIHFAGVVGNHPRLTKKMSSKRRFDNFDWLVYHTMQQRLRAYPQIKWQIPKAQKWPVEICGRRVLLYHGDGIRSTMTDVPWGGIIRYTNKLANQYARAGKPIDHFACGHFHEANAVKNRRILMNGSIKGVDEYSVDAFGGGEAPTQLLTTFHKRRGLTDVSFIDLEGAVDQKKAA